MREKEEERETRETQGPLAREKRTPLLVGFQTRPSTRSRPARAFSSAACQHGRDRDRTRTCRGLVSPGQRTSSTAGVRASSKREGGGGRSGAERSGGSDASLALRRSSERRMYAGVGALTLRWLHATGRSSHMQCPELLGCSLNHVARRTWSSLSRSVGSADFVRGRASAAPGSAAFPDATLTRTEPGRPGKDQKQGTANLRKARHDQRTTARTPGLPPCDDPRSTRVACNAGGRSETRLRSARAAGPGRAWTREGSKGTAGAIGQLFITRLLRHSPLQPSHYHRSAHLINLAHLANAHPDSNHTPSLFSARLRRHCTRARSPLSLNPHALDIPPVLLPPARPPCSPRAPCAPSSACAPQPSCSPARPPNRA